jgi:hypothetical protein
MVASIARIQSPLISSWIKYRFVTVVPKYLNCDTFSNGLNPTLKNMYQYKVWLNTAAATNSLKLESYGLKDRSSIPDRSFCSPPSSRGSSDQQWVLVAKRSERERNHSSLSRAPVKKHEFISCPEYILMARKYIYMRQVCNKFGSFKPTNDFILTIILSTWPQCAKMLVALSRWKRYFLKLDAFLCSIAPKGLNKL